MSKLSIPNKVPFMCLDGVFLIKNCVLPLHIFENRYREMLGLFYLVLEFLEFHQVNLHYMIHLNVTHQLELFNLVKLTIMELLT